MNRTLFSMVRSMMFFKNVKLMFWGEKFLCSSYIHNRCPSSFTNNISPYEMWYNCLPVVQHFRVFASLCYALIPKHQRNNLGARSYKCIFLGYSTTSKAYRLYDGENKKLIPARDVIFLESNRDSSTVDRQLAQLEKFASKKLYFELIMMFHILGGRVPILDQYVVFPSLNHENDEDVTTEENLEDSGVSAGSETVP